MKDREIAGRKGKLCNQRRRFTNRESYGGIGATTIETIIDNERGRNTLDKKCNERRRNSSEWQDLERQESNDDEEKRKLKGSKLLVVNDLTKKGRNIRRNIAKMGRTRRKSLRAQ